MAHESLAGLSVGDAFGNENFTPRTVVVLPGAPEGVWPWTDDTQMACSLVEVLVRHGRVEQAELARAFAARGERFRDYGRGALRFMEAIRRGGDWREASVGLFDGIGSWGNGGAMRVTPLGAWFADDLDRAATEAAASAEVTHAHPEGIAGGIAAGVAAAWAAGRRGRVVEDPAEVLEIVLGYVPDDAPLVRMGIDRAAGCSGRTPAMPRERWATAPGSAPRTPCRSRCGWSRHTSPTTRRRSARA